ncbi:hypothetical protein DAEQUDRAFT_815381 [Daedalea quercina L-15889]|uniref:Uncharacterized protein n=1 Tax=Daedalea quercina L-15889 TaxID=1314783 RepID=A0A165L142_9APHY|nr:hypothetical protein DAEQUDRAFT_815381 [Daedalea quercina L-15889]
MSGLPQQLDLLEQYRGLVVLGCVKYDKEQVQVITQLTRLQRELNGYAPPALASHYLHHSNVKEAGEDARPWWAPVGTSESAVDEDVTPDQGALHGGNSYHKLRAFSSPVRQAPARASWQTCAAMPTQFKARKHYSEVVLEVYRAVCEETRLRMTSVYSAASSAAEESICMMARACCSRALAMGSWEADSGFLDATHL